MKIQTIPISKINPAKYNPRIELKPGDPMYEKLKLSLDKFGYVEPMVWNKQTGNLVGGHQRFNVLKADGAKEVQVSVVNLSLTDEKALNLALNKIQGDWDQDKLAQLLDDLTQEQDFDLGLTGFDLADPEPPIQTADDDHDAVEDEFDADELAESIDDPVTKSGDLIELGIHRLLCGDSSSQDSWIRLLNGVTSRNGSQSTLRELEWS